MSPAWNNTLILLRIPFSFFLLPVFLFALAYTPHPQNTWQVFLILHLLIYPASNGYNSYVDRDETPIGGLKSPPPPPIQLFWVSLILDIVGIVWALALNPAFGLGILGFVLASRAYSAPWPRLKRFPILGFLTVFFFQGAWTFLTIWAGLSDSTLAEVLTAQNLQLAAISSFLIGGSYPLTQIYQHKEDQERGDRSLSLILGYRGTLIFSSLGFASSAMLMFWRLPQADLLILGLCLLPTLLYFQWWTWQIWQDTQAASFQATMRMNLLAATCLALGFGLVVLL